MNSFMNFFKPMLAHSDMGLSQLFIWLSMVLFVAWIVAGIFVLINLVLIFSLRSSFSFKNGVFVFRGSYALPWAILMYGLPDRILVPDYLKLFVIILVPIFASCHFTELLSSYRKLCTKNKDSASDESPRHP
jgi:hypothetical protein